MNLFETNFSKKAKIPNFSTISFTVRYSKIVKNTQFSLFGDRALAHLSARAWDHSVRILCAKQTTIDAHDLSP